MTGASYLESNRTSSSIKFLYSYGGRIIPRFSDGDLRYIVGFTRVVSVDRSISFADLMIKFVELCGILMSLKCKLPREDLDLLVSIKSDEDLQNVIGEYDRDAPGLNIRAILFPFASLKHISPPSSPVLRANYTPVNYQLSKFAGSNIPQHPSCLRKYLVYPPSRLQNCTGGCRCRGRGRQDGLRDAYYRRDGNSRQLYHVPNPMLANRS